MTLSLPEPLQIQFGHLYVTVIPVCLRSEYSILLPHSTTNFYTGWILFISTEINPGKVWNPTRAFRDWELLRVGLFPPQPQFAKC